MASGKAQTRMINQMITMEPKADTPTTRVTNKGKTVTVCTNLAPRTMKITNKSK